MVLYSRPQDPAAFDRYYQETHGPLAKTLLRLKGHTLMLPFRSAEREPEEAIYLPEHACLILRVPLVLRKKLLTLLEKG
jgi:uncharacterized protein (TIGR02118 family)